MKTGTVNGMKNLIIDNQNSLFDKSVFETFIKPGEITEIRALSLKGTISGYFDNHDAFSEAVRTLDGQSYGGIYFTPQVIDPRLLARAFNKMKPGIPATSDNNVLFYRWLLIDVDPARPSGISSSDTELQEALTLRDTVSDVDC